MIDISTFCRKEAYTQINIFGCRRNNSCIRYIYDITIRISKSETDSVHMTIICKSSGCSALNSIVKTMRIVKIISTSEHKMNSSSLRFSRRTIAFLNTYSNQCSECRVVIWHFKNSHIFIFQVSWYGTCPFRKIERNNQCVS